MIPFQVKKNINFHFSFTNQAFLFSTQQINKLYHSINKNKNKKVSIEQQKE